MPNEQIIAIIVYAAFAIIGIVAIILVAKKMI